MGGLEKDDDALPVPFMFVMSQYMESRSCFESPTPSVRRQRDDVCSEPC